MHIGYPIIVSPFGSGPSVLGLRPAHSSDHHRVVGVGMVSIPSRPLGLESLLQLAVQVGMDRSSRSLAVLPHVHTVDTTHVSQVQPHGVHRLKRGLLSLLV